MKRLWLAVLGVAAMAGFWVAQAYDLPEMIVKIEGSEPSLYNFGTDFCCVGDVNGDGYDDLLVNHAPFETGYSRYNFANQVELYYGGDPMDDEPDFIYSTNDTMKSVGVRIQYLGYIDDSDEPYIGIQVVLYENRLDNRPVREVWLYKIGDDFDSERRFQLTFGERVDRYRGVTLGFGRATRPCDLNGDGFNDVIVFRPATDTTSQMVVYWGGADFDTEPDWIVNIRGGFTAELSSGLDFNNDGYDDLLAETSYERPPELYLMSRYHLFLGGEEMDTIPAFSFEEDEFEGKDVYHGFSMLPDVNGDGYDDMGFNYYRVPRERWDEDGVLVFFGSDEPDMVPDLDLEGHNNPFSLEGEVAGGDFNADRVGDIVFANFGGNQDEGEINIYLGSQWMEEEPDIVINCRDDYDSQNLGRYIGAVGDYNGDGVDDFVAQRTSARIPSFIVVFAGDDDWETSVPNERPPEYSVTFTANPNPFNDKTVLEYELSRPGCIDIAIYDIRGRMVASLLKDTIVSGNRGRVSWSSGSSGIYFAVLHFSDASGKTQTLISKLVCIR
jgi:hypothetical protein